MAKQSYLGANVTGTDSFSGWIDKTNQVRNDMGTIVVTVTTVAGAEPNTTNSGLTTGNAAIAGVLTANTIAVSQYLRGGTVTSNAALTITSNAIFQGSLTYLTSTNTTIGDAATDVLNVNAISDFNANVNIDGILTTTANTLLSGVNNTIGTVGSNILNINSTILSNSNAAFSGALVNITSTNTTIGDMGTDVLNVNATSEFNANVNIDGILTVTSNTIFSGANLNINGNTTIGDLASDRLIVNSVLASDLIPIDTSIDLGTISSTYGNVHTLATYSKDIAVSNTVTVANTLTVNTQANTASLMVRNLTATRIPYIGTSGQFIDSENLTFSGTGLSVLGTLVVNNAITASNTLNVTGLATLSSANVTVLATLASANITGLATISSANITTLATLASANITGLTTANTINIIGGANLSSTLAVAGIVTASSDLVLNGSGARTIKVDSGLNALGSFNFVIANNTVGSSNTVLVVNTTGLFSSANAAYDLGSSAVTWRNIYGREIIVANSLSVGGNTSITGSLLVTGTITTTSPIDLTLNVASSNTSTVTSLLSVNGSTILGDGLGSDFIQFNASANSSLLPASNATYSLGNTTNYWANTYSNNTITNTIVQQYAIQSTQAVTIATITETQIAAFSSTIYGSAEMIITTKQGTNRHITKLLIVHNGTTAYATEYGSILTGTSLATYNVDISGGNVRVLATPASTSSTTFNVILTLINA